MKMRDIVRRDTVNLTNCDQEQIHIPGSIQQFGFLLGLKVADLTIDFCSANAIVFTGIAHKKLLGKNAKIVLGGAQLDSLKKYISYTGHSSAAPLQIELVASLLPAQLN